jgi:hypothetical protein
MCISGKFFFSVRHILTTTIVLTNGIFDNESDYEEKTED